MRNVENLDLMIVFLTAVGLFFFFAVFTIVHLMIYRSKQRSHALELVNSKKDFEDQLLRVQVEVQENTYHHIAKDLHDNVGQLLSTTKMLLGITELRYEPVPDTLLTASNTLVKAIEELRLVSRSLDKEWLAQFNFLENLQGEVNRINDGGIVKASVICDTAITMEPQQQVIVFRIVQEAIQNAIRHGRPKHLKVSITHPENLQIKVVNDGISLPVDFSGMGTTNMRHRARLFGGTVDWHSETQTTVTITLPIKQAHENQSRFSG